MFFHAAWQVRVALKSEFLLLCQQNHGTNLICHPVHLFFSGFIRFTISPSGLEARFKFIVDTMLPVTSPDVAAMASVLVKGGFDKCMYEVSITKHFQRHRNVAWCDYKCITHEAGIAEL